MNTRAESGFASCTPVKNIATTQVSTPTINPRTIAPVMKPIRSSTGPSGATNRSTRVPCILQMKMLLEAFMKALLAMPRNNRPGTMNEMYGTPSTSC